MFKIGDFSKLSQVSVRALRLYDRMGLLKPAHVDQFTGYRYYSADQLSRLNRLVAFKDLGFSLEQTLLLLDEKIPPSQIRGMLRLKQAELQHLIEVEQTRLARVEARLEQIEQEDSLSTYDIVLKKVEPQIVVAIRDVLPVCSDIKQLHYELETYLGNQNVEIVGFPQTVWHDIEYRRHDVDAEAVVPINKFLSGSARVTTYELPSVEQMACVIHRASYDTVIKAFNALLKWIEANNYQIVGPNREVYLDSEATDVGLIYTVSDIVNCVVNRVSNSVIEIQFPIQKV